MKSTLKVLILMGFVSAAVPATWGAEGDSFKRFRYDFGASAVSSSAGTSNEAHFGLDYYLQRWLFVRGAPFVRFGSGIDTFYGLDTSLSGSVSFQLAESLDSGLMLGGGYRVTNVQADAPFTEGGISIRAGGFSLSGSMKYILHSASTPGAQNERIYTISTDFAGAGSF